MIIKGKITNQIIQIIKQIGIVRPRDMDEYGIHRKYIHMLYKQGILNRIGRGLYTLPNAELSENLYVSETTYKKVQMEKILHEKYEIDHMTVQFEFEACDDKGVIGNK